jgi:hypothetical protein
VYAVASSQHFLNGPSLCWIEEVAGVRMGRCLLHLHDRCDGILAALHVAYRRQFRGDGLAGGELSAGLMLLALNDLELAAAVPLLEVSAHATAIKLHIATHNTTKARHPSNTGCTYATPSSSRLPSKSSPHEGKPHVSGQTS